MSPVNKVFHEKGAQYFVTLLYFFERKCCKKVLYKRGTSMFFTPDYTETQGIHATKFKTETTSAVAPIKKNWTSKSLYDERTRKVVVFYCIHQLNIMA